MSPEPCLSHCLASLLFTWTLLSHSTWRKDGSQLLQAYPLPRSRPREKRWASSSPSCGTHLLAPHWLWLGHMHVPGPAVVTVFRRARSEQHVSSWSEVCRLRFAGGPQRKIIALLLTRRQANWCWLSNSISSSFSNWVDFYSFGLHFVKNREFEIRN
jgi:hypothetical protein